VFRQCRLVVNDEDAHVDRYLDWFL
jgi:hypothetical protein